MTFKLSIKNIGLFAFIWLNIGVALGLAVLVGPVRWAATYSRENNYSDSSENLLIKTIIIAFVAFSFIVSVVFVAQIVKAKGRILKIVAGAVCLALGSFALYKLLNPEKLATFAAQEKSVEGKQFVFGPYPGEVELQKLKQEGHTTVISLLHPAVTPFEPMLLKEEEENCKKAGLKLISIPMLPWISENEEALKRIKQLAEHPEGKYYVHCYLGKDRVNLAKRLIATYNKSIKPETAGGSERSLDHISKFERGDITKISDKIYFTPFPTDEEYTGYLIAGGVQQVVSLMDPTDPEQKTRIDAERSLLDTYHIPFKNISISSAKDEKQLAKLKELLSTMPKPLVIHRFFSNTPDDVTILEALKK